MKDGRWCLELMSNTRHSTYLHSNLQLLPNAHGERVDVFVQLIQQRDRLDDHVVHPVHVELHFGSRVAVAKTQLGLGCGQRGQTLDQGVEVKTDTWRERERAEKVCWIQVRGEELCKSSGRSDFQYEPSLVSGLRYVLITTGHTAKSNQVPASKKPQKTIALLPPHLCLSLPQPRQSGWRE